MKKEIILIFFLLLFAVSFASAYIPIISTSTGVAEIKNPEISQSFYAELSSGPEYYKIGSINDFNFYVHILSPEIKDAKKDFTAEIYKDSMLISTLNGSEHNWTKFHEDFANDDYLSGPEFNENASAGIYTIKIYNPENTGKYVLIVGKKEQFPVSDIIKTTYTIPEEKIYFNKPFFYAYFTKISLFFFWPLIIVLVILIIAIIKIHSCIKKVIIKKADKYCSVKRSRRTDPIEEEDITET